MCYFLFLSQAKVQPDIQNTIEVQQAQPVQYQTSPNQQQVHPQQYQQIVINYPQSPQVLVSARKIIRIQFYRKNMKLHFGDCLKLKRIGKSLSNSIVFCLIVYNM